MNLLANRNFLLGGSFAGKVPERDQKEAVPFDKSNKINRKLIRIKKCLEKCK